MFRNALLVIAGLSLAGCSAETELSNPFKGDAQAQHNKLAAYAATSKYPASQPSNDLRAVALISRGNGNIRLINTSDQALRDVRVWVDGNYVSRVDSIPPHGIVTLSRGDFFDSSGASLNKQNNPITKVQVESADHFYNMQGPVFE